MLPRRFTIRSLFVLVTACAIVAYFIGLARGELVGEVVAVVVIGTVAVLGLLLTFQALFFLALWSWTHLLPPRKRATSSGRP